MDKNNTVKRGDGTPDPGNGNNQEGFPEARSERYLRKVEALNDCMLE
jgi:hypothetical protein